MDEVLAPDGVRISFRDEGSGPAVVLLHGISADGDMNWEWTGIGPAIRDAGFRTIALDQRGHGRSDKPRLPADYHDDRFADDVAAVLDAIAIESCTLVGYSMGGYMALRSTAREPRVIALVVGGIGDAAPKAWDREDVARALETDEPDALPDGEGRSIREYADTTGADRQALAAIQRGRSEAPFDLAAIDVPVLVIVGQDDDLAGSASSLADALASATLVRVPGDHASALIEPRFRDAIVAFLDAQLRD